MSNSNEVDISIFDIISNEFTPVIGSVVYPPVTVCHENVCKSVVEPYHVTYLPSEKERIERLERQMKVMEYVIEQYKEALAALSKDKG